MNIQFLNMLIKHLIIDIAAFSIYIIQLLKKFLPEENDQNLDIPDLLPMIKIHSN